MITRDEIFAAAANVTLINFIAAADYSQREALARLLSEMHNSGEINFLSVCNSGQLNTISDVQFANFQRVFRLTLPRIQCHAADAMTASTQLNRRADGDITAILVFEALCEWFQQDSIRIEEGLAAIQRDLDNQTGTITPLLLAGAEQDSKRFIAVALDLSEHAQPQVRSSAIRVLGSIVPKDDDQLLNRTLNRFSEVVKAENSEQDIALALEAALCLLHRTDGSIVDVVRPLLERACEKPSALLRHVIGSSLHIYRSAYDESMIDTAFKALQTTGKKEVNTVQTINSFLYTWDIDGDRKRIFRFLSKLLGGRDDAIDLEALDNFTQCIRKEKGEVLGWYVVSFLLTGDEKLCANVRHLLPYKKPRDGFDIDLGSFALAAPWIAYLTRKILGYCLHEKHSSAALLLSCLRAASESSLSEIESLIYDYFLMNYLTAIELFENAISENDPACESVSRLSLKLKSYVNTLNESGFCQAFSPTERERQLQRDRKADFWKKIQKQAEEHSLLSSLAHRANIRYGTTSIVYMYTDDSTAPQRQEIPMSNHKHIVELPRLDVIDQVGLHNAIFRFRSESPPV